MVKLHLDRLASVYFCYPLAKASTLGWRTRLPILMYHGIQCSNSGRHPYYETNTSPRAFASQMKYLRDNGYETMDLEGALRSLEQGEKRDRRVVVTFDDGYADFYSAAYPILSEYGFKATVFLVSGHTGDQRLQFKGKECLTWSEVRELHSKGICIGSHTVTHPELKLLNRAEVEYEISRSKQAIEDKIGSSVKSFSYPFAFPEADQAFTGFLESKLAGHGYQNGVSTIIGRASGRSHRFFLPRLPVNTWDDVRFFQAKLEGAYDWVHAFQYAHKLIRTKQHSAVWAGRTDE